MESKLMAARHQSRRHSMFNVALHKGKERHETVSGALKLIQDDIDLPDKPVLIKPNLVSTTKGNELAVTHRDAVTATMDFLKDRGVDKFIIADGAGLGAKIDPALDNFGYRELKDRYNVEFRDLNFDQPVELTLLDSSLRPRKYQIAKTVVDSYCVSVARMKTHDTVVVTLAIKNTVIGSLVGSNKSAVHQGYPAMNLSMAKIATAIPNDLSIIDGIEGMDGNGPVGGTAIYPGVVVASVDPVACDMVGCEVMGFEPDEVGYLYYLRRMQGLSREQIQVLGETVEACKTIFKPHSRYHDQLKWRVENWEQLLGMPPISQGA
jgi:uncharacterized protein (DUF362 family)